MTQQKLYNVTITFDDKRGGSIGRLTDAQISGLSAILEASGVWYSWRGELADRRQAVTYHGGFLARLWGRLNAWLMPLLILAVLTPGALAQKPLEPVRVAVEAQGDEEIRPLVLAQMRRFRDVVIVQTGGDYNVRVVVAKDGECRRFIVATVVAVRTTGRFGLSIDSGADLRELAAAITAKIDTDYFQHRKEKK